MVKIYNLFYKIKNIFRTEKQKQKEVEKLLQLKIKPDKKAISSLAESDRVSRWFSLVATVIAITCFIFNKPGLGFVFLISSSVLSTLYTTQIFNAQKDADRIKELLKKHLNNK